MIKQTLSENVLSLSIAKRDFSYRIPVDKIAITIDWKIGQKDSPGIVINNVSAWTLQLFTKAVTEEKFIRQFKSIVQEHSPENTIDWQETLMAVAIQNKYNWLVESSKTAKRKVSEEEIIIGLKEQFKIG